MPSKDAVIDVEPVEVPESVETPPEKTTPEKATPKYHRIDHDGVSLEVRKPQPKALAAFSLATSKHVPQDVRNDMTGYFVYRHFSPESYELVFYRLMDPDDTKYTAETVGEIMRSIVALAAE